MLKPPLPLVQAAEREVEIKPVIISGTTNIMPTPKALRNERVMSLKAMSRIFMMNLPMVQRNA